MKNIKKITAFLFCAIIAFASAACKSCGKRRGGNESAEIPLTDISVLAGGVSDYKVVIPADPSNDEAIASFELTDFFQEATGCSLKIIDDSGLTLNAQDKYISLGRTSIFAQSGLAADKASLGDDGYIVKRKDKSVFIAGGGTKGTLYGAYFFLKHTIGYEAFSVDEIAYEHKSDIFLPDFNETDIPDFPKRAVLYYETSNDAFYQRRMRTEKYNDSALWGLWAHTYYRLLPTATYLSGHPDWYSSNVYQLCLTRDVGDLDAPNASTENMRYTFVENLKKYIRDYPDAIYFMLGQEDTGVWCDCQSCNASDAAYGGPAGTMMRFVNAVARDIKAWLPSEFPGRHVILGTFAYHKTTPAPVKRDGENAVLDAHGKPVPAHPSVVAEDNVAVMLAPLHGCYAHDFSDGSCKFNKNADTYQMFQEWPAVTRKMFLWSYCTNFHNYFVNHNSFPVLKANYKLFKDIGTEFMFDQGTSDSKSPAFSELRLYVQSNLMWNTDLSVNVLIEKFIKQYYRGAAPLVQEYFDGISTHYAAMNQKHLASQKNEDEPQELHLKVLIDWAANEDTRASWPKNLVMKNYDLLNAALKEAEKETDPVLRRKLVDRVKKQRLSPLYMLIDIYGYTYDRVTLSSMIDLFEADAAAAETERYREATSNSDYSLRERISDWRKAL